MKKRIFVLFTVFFAVLIAFSSCGKNEDDDHGKKELGIMEKISMAMDNVSSLEAQNQLNIESCVDNENLQIISNTEYIYSKEENEDLYFYSAIDMTLKYKEAETKNSAIEAFNDGQYFFSYAIDGNKTNIRSRHTAQEFMDYYETFVADKNILEEYGELSYVENSDKTYTVTLTKYNDDLIKDINNNYGFPFENEGVKITEIAVIITANADFLINEVNVNYKFSDSESIGSQKITFSKYNMAEKNLENIQKSNYFIVDDARSVPMLLTLLNEKANSDKGKLNFSMGQVIYVVGSKTEYKEESDVLYGVKNGNYYFDINSEINGEKHSIVYDNGIYKVDEVEQEGYNDFTAKQFIDGLIDPFSFLPTQLNINYLKKTENDDGTTFYEIDLIPDKTSIKKMVSDILGAYNASYNRRTEIKLGFVVRGDELISLEYTIEGSGDIKQSNSYYGVSVLITTSTVFNVEDVDTDNAS